MSPNEVNTKTLALAKELKQAGATSEQIQASMLGFCSAIAVQSGVKEEEFVYVTRISYRGYVKIHSKSSEKK